MKLNAKQLRTQPVNPEIARNIPKNPIYIILDNVLDTYNIGALFRLADAIAAEEMLLCGDTETPPNPRIKKASINTWQWVKWEYFSDTVQAIVSLRKRLPQISVIALEQDKNSIPLKTFQPCFPVAVIVGNETFGINKDILKLADTTVELPMYGINTSLNAMVSCGIVLYKLVEFLPNNPQPLK